MLEENISHTTESQFGNDSWWAAWDLDHGVGVTVRGVWQILKLESETTKKSPESEIAKTIILTCDVARLSWSLSWSVD